MAESTANEAERRFEHLLKPLRDLAENWSIDLADELGEYLEDLAGIEVSLDGGKTTVNFAQAALLIQGSAYIYSRKVEYLYKLVQHALATILKGGEEAEAGNTVVMQLQEEDSDVVTATHWADEEFLPLDDVPEGTDIDLDEEDIPRDKLPTSAQDSEIAPLIESREEDGTERPRMSMCEIDVSGALVLDDTAAELFAAERAERGEDGTFEASGTVDASGAGMADADPGDADFDDFGGSWDDVGNVGPQEGGTTTAPKAPSQWAMLDPDDESGNDPRPFRKGRTAHSRSTVYTPGASAAAAAPLSVVRFASEEDELRQREPPLRLNARTLRAAVLPENDAAVRNVRRLRAKRLARELAAAGRGAAGDAAYTAFGIDAEGGAWLDDEAALDDFGDGGFEYGDDNDVALEEFDEHSYEKEVQKHMDTYMRDVERYRIETDLSRRVQDWQRRIEPVLKEEELRGSFDIGEYGDKIIGVYGSKEDAERAKSKKNKGKVLDFGALSQGADAAEVCRLFLAMLQLANYGNVEIHVARGADGLVENDPENGLQCELLTREKKFASMNSSMLATVQQ